LASRDTCGKGESEVGVFFRAALNDSSTGYKFSDIGSFSDFPGATKEITNSLYR